MAIEILTGVPGAGKSYYAVYRIYQLLHRDDWTGLVLHNIEGLSVPDNRCILCTWDTSSFSVEKMSEYLNKLRLEYNLSSEDVIHFYIDEAQRFFPPELKDSQVLYFFDYHRHFGVHITLITQHEKKLTYKITTLSDLEIRAVSSRINPFGSFIYKLSSSGEHFGTERLSKKPEIFSLYQSFRAGTGKAKKSRFRYLVLALVVSFPLLVVLFFRVFSASFGKFDSSAELSPPLSAASLQAPSAYAAAPAPAPVPLSDPNPNSTTRFLGPAIKEYSSSRDAVLLDVSESGLEGWLSLNISLITLLRFTGMVISMLQDVAFLSILRPILSFFFLLRIRFLSALSSGRSLHFFQCQIILLNILWSTLISLLCLILAAILVKIINVFLCARRVSVMKKLRPRRREPKTCRRPHRRGRRVKKTPSSNRGLT